MDAKEFRAHLNTIILRHPDFKAVKYAEVDRETGNIYVTLENEETILVTYLIG